MLVREIPGLLSIPRKRKRVITPTLPDSCKISGAKIIFEVTGRPDFMFCTASDISRPEAVALTVLKLTVPEE
jgi:hypothetical protein